MTEPEKDWSGKTGGTKGMQQSLISIFRHVDTRWMYWLVALWLLGSIVFQPTSRKGIWHYWRRHRGKGVGASVWHLWRHYWAFADAILDRFAAYSGRQYSIRVEGGELMDELQAQPGGFMVVSSHVGNQEMAGYSIRSKKPMNVLLYLGDTATVNENRERLFAAHGLRFLPMQADGSHIFEMHQVLERGEVLSIHGDRLFYGAKSMRAAILGGEALFPEGPFRVAALEHVPVLTMFVMREGAGRYTLYIRSLSCEGDDRLSKKELTRQLLTRYICEMEQILEKYPYQWFHFYEFWKK